MDFISHYGLNIRRRREDYVVSLLAWIWSQHPAAFWELVPTSSATSCEATRGAVFVEEHKWMVSGDQVGSVSQAFRPDISVLKAGQKIVGRAARPALLRHALVEVKLDAEFTDAQLSAYYLKGTSCPLLIIVPDRRLGQVANEYFHFGSAMACGPDTTQQQLMSHRGDPLIFVWGWQTLLNRLLKLDEADQKKSIQGANMPPSPLQAAVLALVAIIGTEPESHYDNSIMNNFSAKGGRQVLQSCECIQAVANRLKTQETSRPNYTLAVKKSCEDIPGYYGFNLVLTCKAGRGRTLSFAIEVSAAKWADCGERDDLQEVAPTPFWLGYYHQDRLIREALKRDYNGHNFRYGKSKSVAVPLYGNSSDNSMDELVSELYEKVLEIFDAVTS